MMQISKDTLYHLGLGSMGGKCRYSLLVRF